VLLLLRRKRVAAGVDQYNIGLVCNKFKSSSMAVCTSSISNANKGLHVADDDDENISNPSNQNRQ
jgi:hypothetical protein